MDQARLGGVQLQGVGLLLGVQARVSLKKKGKAIV